MKARHRGCIEAGNPALGASPAQNLGLTAPPPHIIQNNMTEAGGRDDARMWNWGGIGKTAVAAAVAALASSEVYANGVARGCPSEWAEYVATVAEIIEPLGEDFPLLFVSREGDVFDCLGRIRDSEFLRLAQRSESMLPIDRSTPLIDDPITWPVNVCTNSARWWQGMLQYTAIHLPSEREILQNSACKLRVQRAAQDILAENRNDR